MAASSHTHARSSDGAVGIDTETLTRDRRAAEEPMGIWEIGGGLWGVGTGSEDYSEYVVDAGAGRCTCDDWRFRGGPGRGEITRCKHMARVGMAIKQVLPPADADVCRSLEAQRERFGDSSLL
ncbi:hypothetical protein [Haloterrigena salifodinae]|uniref:hypothetical protein n=1 Tax=Haloterrigena salifodinae TaxID=2675099 RepID=UPI000F87B7FC|nr:hypothetical protein [Haloterrigena salifodinae]